MVVNQYLFLNNKQFNVRVKPLLLSVLLAYHSVVCSEEIHLSIEPLGQAQVDTINSQLKDLPLNTLPSNKVIFDDFLPERLMQIAKIDITKLEYKIFISHQLSPEVIKQILQEASYFNAKVYLRGLIPELNLNQTIQYWQSYAVDYEPVPDILIDPTEFRKNNVVSAPTLVAHYQGDKIASVTGIYSVQWLKYQIESRVKDLVSQSELVDMSQQLTANIQKTNQDHTTFLDFGIQGSSSNINETDLLDILLTRLRTFDFKELKEQAAKRFWQSYPYIQLPKAKKCQRHTLNPTVTLTQPLFSKDGQILLPTGLEYNPLNYLPFTQQLVIFNAKHAEEKAQVKAWLLKQNQNKYHTLIVNELDNQPNLSTLSKLETEFNAQIYLLTPLIQSRFLVTSTPTIISVTENQFVIEAGCL